MGKRVKGNSFVRQGPLINSSRSFYQNIQRFFKKFFIFLKKSCQVFIVLFSGIFIAKRRMFPNLSSFSHNCCTFAPIKHSHYGQKQNSDYHHRFADCNRRRSIVLCIPPSEGKPGNDRTVCHRKGRNGKRIHHFRHPIR